MTLKNPITTPVGEMGSAVGVASTLEVGCTRARSSDSPRKGPGDDL
jgi:hypothetical protein